MTISEKARASFRSRSEEGLEKEAFARIGAILGGSLAVAAAIAGAGALHEKMTRDNDFKTALKESPSAKRNQARAYKHFMTLRRINRSLSRDPLVAAGYMNKAMSYETEGIDPSIALALARPGEKFEMGGVRSDTAALATITSKLLD